MKRSAVSARQGIALVITLIMLSVVTITAVAFLAVSRRDRGSTVSAGAQIDVRFLADAAFNRAKAEVVASIDAASNRFAFGFLASTNYNNPYSNPNFSYLLTGNLDHLTNVNYLNTVNPANPRVFDFSRTGDRALHRQMLANLFYSPRAPVFVQTNSSLLAPTEFRYYLDLNRNGRFETNGLVIGSDAFGRTNGFGPEYVVGDPEWQGYLEHPDAPHSGTNRFLGRVAYVVVPSGRNLDINFNHNAVKSAHGVPDQGGVGTSAFMRNEGVGGWEINLAGFFSDLNTNTWYANAPQLFYRYTTNPATPSSGLAFDDASILLQQRRVAPANLAFSQDFLTRDSGVSGSFANQFRNDRVDWFSDGPIANTLSEVKYGTVDNDVTDVRWAGSDYTNSFIDINQLFSPTLDSTLGFANRLSGTSTNNSIRSSYDNYTFYRMIGQLGLDSSDGRFESGLHPAYATPNNPSGFYRRAKLNLNYAMMDPDGDRPANALLTVTNSGFVTWAPLQWFTNAANRLLLTEFTNGLPFFASTPLGTRFNHGLAVAGGVNVRVTNQAGNQTLIQSYRTNYVYNPQVHRLLQLAANIFDYTTNTAPISVSAPGLPTVFRPMFYTDKGTNKVVRLGGYQPMNQWDSNYFNNWYSPDDPRFLNALSTDPTNGVLNSSQPKPIPAPKPFGIPWVVGAKRGLPEFHEAFWQSAIQVTRRLMFTRRAAQTVMGTSEVPFSGGNGKGFDTLVQYRLRITNSVAVDAYNAYTNSFPLEVTVQVKNVHNFTLKSDFPGGSRVVFNRQLEIPSPPVKVGPNKWLPLSYVTAVNSGQTNALVYDLIYDPVQGAVYGSGTNYNSHFVAANASFTPLTAFITNSMVFVISAKVGAFEKIIDFVTLQSSMIETNVLRFLGETTTGGFGPVPIGGGGGGGGLTPASLWSTNQLSVYGTTGISNQFRVATKRSELPAGQWVNAVGGLDNTQDRDKAIAGLNYFLYHTSAEQLDRSTKAAIDQSLFMQSGYNPTATVFLTDRRMANDPLVHYTADDLVPGYSAYGEPGGYAEVVVGGVRRTPKNGKPFTLDAKVTTNQVGLTRKLLSASAPWGTNANYGYFVPPKVDDANSIAYDMAFKDPGITQSDDWVFPTNRVTRFSNIGQLGRVHRGTPWQTVYMKAATNPIGTVVSRMEGAKSWGAWAGNVETYPARDRNLFDLFTTAINDNSARGLMGVNQTNIASWSALLSGVPILQNNQDRSNPKLAFIQPSSVELKQVLVGYTNNPNARPPVREVIPGLLGTITNTALAPGGYFTGLGSILATPTLTDHSPFLDFPTNSTGWKATRNLTDEVVERLPQQILSLMKADEPRVTVYSYAQTLKPAANSLVTTPGPFYGLCTNYQVTAEYATKTILRLDGPPRDLKTVIEDQRVIYPGN